MFSIGEFSRITGLTAKTIRFYHEKQILVPVRVEVGSGYRYFDNNNIETARAISSLRAMEFSVDEIKSILESCDQDKDVVQQLEQRKHEIAKTIESQTEIANGIGRILKQRRAFRKLAIQEGIIEERELPAMLVGGIGMTGKYSDVGRAYGKPGRALGRYISGSAMCLYFDTEYKEDVADFEPLFPIRERVDNPTISIRELPSCLAACLKHVGSYKTLGRSYVHTQ